MIQTLINKIKSLFSGRKKGAIPFAEKSREAVKDLPVDEVSSKRERTRPSRKKAAPMEGTGPHPKTAPEKKKSWSPADFVVPEEEGKIRFHDLDLPDSILHAVADLEFKYCTPVQAGILPCALTGRDAIGKAQTGTGKSAAFLITIFSHMIRHPIKGGPPKGHPRALILAPTRELVLQIEKDALGLSKYTPFRILSVYGGTGYEKQMKALKEKSFDVIVATPGRLIDFKYKNLIKLDKVEILVLDEADRMLDMGFIPDVRKIVYSTPGKSERQTFFYSATFSPEVTRLAEQWTTEPCKVEIEPDQVASDSVKQVVYITTSNEKFSLLYNLVMNNNLDRVLVFTNRRDQARDLAKKLLDHAISTSLISGEIHQNKRIRALEGFREGKFRILVATDVAARGLHIEDISHVINYNLPQDPENYVHRIGRTGRAGSTGISVSFACEDDSFNIPDIETFLGNNLVCEHPDDDLLTEPPEPVREKTERSPKNDNQENGSSRPRRRRKPGANGRKGDGQSPKPENRQAQPRSLKDDQESQRSKRRPRFSGRGRKISDRVHDKKPRESGHQTDE